MSTLSPARVPLNSLPPDLPRRIIEYGQDLRSRFEKFLADLDAMAALDGEVSEDDVPGLFADFTALATLGVRFDSAFAARMNRVNRLIALVVVEDDTDGDEDASDEHLIDDGTIYRNTHPTPTARPQGRMFHAMKIPGVIR